MSQKGFSKVFIIIILAAIIAFAGVLVYQRNQPPQEQAQPADETADWQTYRNEEYGFEVKYPNGCEFYEEGGGVVFMDRSKELMITLAVTSKSEIADIFGDFSTITEAKTNWEENIGENYKSEEAEISPVAEIITVNGREVLRIAVSFEPVGDPPYEYPIQDYEYTIQGALLIKGEKLFWLRQKYAVSPDTFNQLLFTLRFLD